MQQKKLLPPNYFVICFVLTILLHFVLPAIKIVYFPYNLLGLPFLLFGIWINIWTDNLFKKEDTTVKPFEDATFFITYGPFSISRHPMYLGMTAALLGISILLGSLISFVPLLIFFLIMQFYFIPVEEKSMESIFKDKYFRGRISPKFFTNC